MVKDEIDRPLGAIIVNRDITSEMNRLRENSDLDFSHGICPDCAARLYPGLAIAP